MVNSTADAEMQMELALEACHEFSNPNFSAIAPAAITWPDFEPAELPGITSDFKPQELPEITWDFEPQELPDITWDFKPQDIELSDVFGKSY